MMAVGVSDENYSVIRHKLRRIDKKHSTFPLNVDVTMTAFCMHGYR